jgi:hypothetical protein
VDAEVDEQTGGEKGEEGAVISGSGDEVQVMENEEEGEADGLDDLFEE